MKTERILAIRLQAFGDTLITLPYLNSVRAQLPKESMIDFLTREEVADIPKSIGLFNKVMVLKGKRNTKKQLFWLTLLLPKLLFRRYTIVLDLQNNKLSRVATFFCFTKNKISFDKSSPLYAGMRTALSIQPLFSFPITFNQHFPISFKLNESLLKNLRMEERKTRIVVNPAGFFKNRNWPLENYKELFHILNSRITNVLFIILGLNNIKEKALDLQSAIGENLIDFVDQTSAFEAFCILRHSDACISEDSGLLHLSYISGIPTVGLLGPTRSDWTNPQLDHTYFFTSDDMPCGNCMSSTCILSENRCLTRIKPEEVATHTLALIHKRHG